MARPKSINRKPKINYGYRYLYAPNHPYTGTRGFVSEHRLVMEKAIGRILEPGEVVHHINWDRLDNRIENLELYKNKSSHMSYHVQHTEYYLDQYRDYIINRYKEGVGASIIAKEINSHKPCVLKWMRKNGIPRRLPKLKVICKEGFKWCNVCKRELPLNEFYPNKNTHDGLRNRCRACAKMEAKLSQRRAA